MTFFRRWILRFQSVKAHPQSFRFLLGQIFWRTGCGRWATFRVRDFRLRLFPSNLSWQLWVDPTSRNDTLDLAGRLVGPGDTVVDVGANIGIFSLTAARRVGPEGTVHAIEPHPRTARYLRANLDLNRVPQVRCHTVAIGMQTGIATLTDDRRDDMNYLRDQEAKSQGGVEVPVVSLDELLLSLPACHLLKLDVEGRELDCLRGARDLLRRTRFVLVEAGDSNSRRFGSTAADLYRELTDGGFAVFKMENGKPVPVQPEKPADSVCDWMASRDVESLR